MSLSKSVAGFLQCKIAEGLSPRALTNYEHYLKVLADYLKDASIDQINAPDLRGLFVWLRTEYQPNRLTGGIESLSPKTCRTVGMFQPLTLFKLQVTNL